MSKLWETLDILREQGWCKNALRNPKGEHCVLGALGVAYGATSDELSPYTVGPTDVFHTSDLLDDLTAIHRVVMAQYPERIDPVDFNNHETTTWDDLERVVEKAAIAQDEILA